MLLRACHLHDEREWKNDNRAIAGGRHGRQNALVRLLGIPGLHHREHHHVLHGLRGIPHLVLINFKHIPHPRRVLPLHSTSSLREAMAVACFMGISRSSSRLVVSAIYLHVNEISNIREGRRFYCEIGRTGMQRRVLELESELKSLL